MAEEYNDVVDKADGAIYKWTRFILRRKSVRTNHSISVASSYSFIFCLMEHNPETELGGETLLDSDNDSDNDKDHDVDDDDDDGPYGQTPARVVRMYNTLAGFSVLMIVVNRCFSETDTNADDSVALITHSL